MPRKKMRCSFSPQAFEAIAQRFRVLADPMRLRLLHLLRDGERTVNEMADLAGCSQPNTSRHLAQLQRHGLVARRQEGNCAFYAINDPSVFELCEAVCCQIEQRAKELQKIFD
jgi:DNA-binding transcriptional ArsR family regulator